MATYWIDHAHKVSCRRRAGYGRAITFQVLLGIALLLAAMVFVLYG